MTALLTADEAARLRVGVNVIVRPGDERECDCFVPYLEGVGNHSPGCACFKFVAPQDWAALTGPCPTTCEQPSERGDGSLCGSDYEVSLVDVVRYEGDGESTFFHLPICYGHRLALGEHVIAYEPLPDCRDGRRIVPLYTECPVCAVRLRHWPDADKDYGNQHADCNGLGFVLAGRGSIEVVPVVATPSESPTKACLCPAARGMVLFWHDRQPITAETTPEELHDRSDLIGPFDPLPVPGRDFGIVIDCVEVAAT